MDRPHEGLTADDVREAWAVLTPDERREGFSLLAREDASEFFLSLSARDQADLLLEVWPGERRSWIRLLPPDDAADLIQEAPDDQRDPLLALLDDATRKEVTALLAYAEDDAGGLMNPRYARLRPDMSVDEAISYLRRQTRENMETIYYVYVLDPEQHLLGVVSFRDLFSASPQRRVRDIMHEGVVSVPEEMDQETVSQLFAQHNFLAMPVVDRNQRVVGIVTVDDIVDVVQEEATEDIQKLGGMAALGEPYLETGFRQMVRKRGGWLAALFIGEMLTATAMAHYQEEISRAVILTLFVPLIISSGGNSGSQASTLVVRAMALGEVRLRDWWRVVRRELGAGLALGGMLAVLGLLRIVLWQVLFQTYGPHWLPIALTVAVSLLWVVLLGTLAGSMLPMLLQRFGVDPASASAPFVATLIDVSGLIIYFTVAGLLLRGTLL